MPRRTISANFPKIPRTTISASPSDNAAWSVALSTVAHSPERSLIDRLLGQSIAARRAEAKISAERLAEISGCSAEEISLIEEGALRIQVVQLAAIARSLGVNPMDLIARAGPT